MTVAYWLGIAAACLMLLSAATDAGAQDEQADPERNIGSRLEPFIDHWLIDTLEGAKLRLHPPTPREVAITFDQPWEGSTCTYVTVFQDGDLYRMYYRGSNYDVETLKTTHEELACYAESTDGIHWTRPSLGLFEFEGTKVNNIVWRGMHNFTPFKDANPDCAPDAKYKALGGGSGGLQALKSPDGIHCSLMREEPVITKGAFDSQNLAFFDSVRGRYVDFHRQGRATYRDIMTCYSDDFLSWTEPVFIEYGDAPPEHLYTNAIAPYYRAPHIFMGFPKRFMPGRQSAVHPVKGISDGVFMTSRDGLNFHRWREAFIRPGLQPERWINRNNMTAWGIVQTKAADPGLPDELSLYSNEAYYVPGNRLRRFTVRKDGFVSVNASADGGQLVTKPLVFEGGRLVLNYATSAAGSIRVEITDAAGEPIPGFTLDDCEEIYGDEIDRVVRFKDDPDLGGVAGRAVRLRFVMSDADLYSLQFRPK